jgi:hypothetical protein
MEMTDDGLMLGCGTLLARMTRDPAGEAALDLEGAEDRILTLLALAYGGTVPASVMGHIRRAAEYWCKGDKSLAQINLALARLPRLDDEEAMFRLFLADRLIADGLSSTALMKTFNLDQKSEVEKFNPYQPRVSAGSGKESGRWTSSGKAGRDANLVFIQNTHSDAFNRIPWDQVPEGFKLGEGSAEPFVYFIDGDVRPKDFPNLFNTAKDGGFSTIGDETFGAVANKGQAVTGATLFTDQAVIAFDGSHVVKFSPSFEGDGLIITLNKDHTITIVQSPQQNP